MNEKQATEQQEYAYWCARHGVVTLKPIEIKGPYGIGGDYCGRCFAEMVAASCKPVVIPSAEGDA